MVGMGSAQPEPTCMGACHTGMHLLMTACVPIETHHSETSLLSHAGGRKLEHDHLNHILTEWQGHSGDSQALGATETRESRANADEMPRAGFNKRPRSWTHKRTPEPYSMGFKGFQERMATAVGVYSQSRPHR